MSTDFATFEREGWQRVAHKYEAAWSGLTQGFIPKLIKSAGIASGQNVLDVACGPGYVSEAVAQLGARPVGIDFSPEMIRLAKEHNPNLHFAIGDAQALEFEPDSFDAVVMNFGLLHLSHPEAAFVESFRVLRSGGCYGFTVWAGPDLSPGAKIVDDAIKAHADLQIPLPQGPDYFCFGRASECMAVLNDAGFERGSLRFETVTSNWKLPTATFLFECERYAGVRTAALLARQSEDALNKISKQIADGVAVYAKGNAFVLPFAAHVVTARKR
ncbi:MAG TPA: methyltransferase domain-containing protein [Pyrinomonadaceae bacterium]|jgi:SAM-dependent methyltransferase|nr:methyltransferase domain-containing protein [Pyrinomonadaceae bacterium]